MWIQLNIMAVMGWMALLLYYVPNETVMLSTRMSSIVVPRGGMLFFILNYYQDYYPAAAQLEDMDCGMSLHRTPFHRSYYSPPLEIMELVRS